MDTECCKCFNKTLTKILEKHSKVSNVTVRFVTINKIWITCTTHNMGDQSDRIV